MSIKKRLPPEDDSPIMRRFVQVITIIATFAISAIFQKGRRCALPPPNHAPTPHDLTPRTNRGTLSFNTSADCTGTAPSFRTSCRTGPDFRRILTNTSHARKDSARKLSAGSYATASSCRLSFYALPSFYLFKYARLIQYPVPVHRPKLLASWSIEMTAPFGSLIGV